MKTCVFITGTNAVGKSSIARGVIDRCGGVNRVVDMVTYCNDGVTALAGPYTCKYGGVDRITNEKGSSCTSKLAEVVERGLQTADIIFCEGSFMNTFGLHLTNAMFKAQRYMVVNLYADALTLLSRLQGRSNGKNGKRDMGKIINKQKQSMIAAQKWHNIGVKVLQIDTSIYSADEIISMIYGELERVQPQ